MTGHSRSHPTGRLTTYLSFSAVFVVRSGMAVQLKHSIFLDNISHFMQIQQSYELSIFDSEQKDRTDSILPVCHRQWNLSLERSVHGPLTEIHTLAVKPKKTPKFYTVQY